MNDAFLVLNAGSSSIKFSLFPKPSSRFWPAGRWRQSTPSPSSLREDAAGKPLAEKRWPAEAKLGTKPRSATWWSG